MKFRCETCKSRYSIADEKVRNKIIKITCPKCGSRILLRDRHNDMPDRLSTGALTDHGAVKNEAPQRHQSVAAPLPKRAESAPAETAAKVDRAEPLTPTDDISSRSLENRSRSALHRLLSITDERAEWFVRCNGSNEGPLSLVDVRARLQALRGQGALVWNPRFGSEWRHPEQVEELRDAVSKGSPPPVPRRATGSASHLRVIEGGRSAGTQDSAPSAPEITKEPLRPMTSPVPDRARAGHTAPDGVKETLQEGALGAAVESLAHRAADAPNRSRRASGLHALAASAAEAPVQAGDPARPQINPARLREGSIVSKLSRISAAPQTQTEPVSDTPPQSIAELPQPVPSVLPSITPFEAREALEHYASSRRQFQLLSAISVVVVLIAITAVVLWKYRIEPEKKTVPQTPPKERIVRLPSAPAPVSEPGLEKTGDRSPRVVSDAPETPKTDKAPAPVVAPPTSVVPEQNVAPQPRPTIELAPVELKRPKRPTAPKSHTKPHLAPSVVQPKTPPTSGKLTPPAPKKPLVVVPTGIEETEVTSLRREIKNSEPTIETPSRRFNTGSDELKVHKSRLVRKLNHCLRAANRLGIEGKLPINFTILTSGRVTSLALPPSIQSPGIQSCLRTTVGGFVFPQQQKPVNARLILIP